MFSSTCNSSGYRVAQLRVIFSIPEGARNVLFTPGTKISRHLAYVEWFSKFTANPEPDHWMYKLSRAMKDSFRYATIIPIANIRRSVLLFPKFGPVAPPHWTSENVLEECNTFYLDPFVDDHSYVTIY